MPTRTQVIDSLIQRYDAQITGTEAAVIEPAMIKLLIAQLVDKVFGGGSGGGTATELRQIDGNNYLSTIDSNTAQSLTTLNDIVTELRDDTFVSESVWFDRKNVLEFYIRRLTFDQDTQTPVLAWYDKDGNTSAPDVSLLIQGNSTSELQTEIINQINAINGVTQQIQTNQQNQQASQITQAQVQAAIQGAADIDTIIARLASIDAKTIAPTASQPAKTTLPGFTSVAAINNNLLDASGLGAWTDVRTYQSCELTLAAGAGSFGFTGLLGSLDSIGSNPSTITAFNSGNGISNITVSIGSGTVLKLKYDLTGVNFVRFGNTTAIAGNKVSGVFNSFATTAQVVAQIAGTVQTTVNGTVATAPSAPATVADLFGVITTTQNNGSIAISPGQSYQVNIEVSSIAGTLAQSIVTLQEQSNPAGTTYRTVYVFEPITVANGARVYKSPVLTATGSRYRIIETVTGTTPSINRTISRTTIAATGLINQDTRSQTFYNANLASIDVPVYGVIRAINALTTLATPLWIQLHDSITPVAPSAQPRVSIRIPVDGLILGSAYFGEGRLWGGLLNPRIAISTSANGYTQISLAANTVQLFIEAI
jgi:hypothetical protein